MFPECEYPNLPGPPIQPRILPMQKVGLRIVVNEEGISHIQLNHGELVLFRDVVDYPLYDSNSLFPTNIIECLFCRRAFKKTQYEQKYCSTDCYHKSRIGRKMPPRSDEWRRKKSESLKKKYVGKGNPFYGKHHTEETKQIIREKQIANPKFRRIGEEHWNWKGGTSKESHKLRSCQELKIWRRAVYERDNYTCQDCGTRSRKGNKALLNAHHIKPFMEYPELRFEVSNGRTLCEECHRKLHMKPRQELPEAIRKVA